MDSTKAFWLFPPRLVVLISTIDKEGNENVAPHSEFINLYGNKHFLVAIDKNHDTYKNIKETKEFVVGLPTIKIARAISISGKSFPKGISEFKEANLTPIKAKKVCAPLIKECAANFECKLSKEFTTPEEENLILGEIIHLSYDEKFIKENEEETRLNSPIAMHIYKGRVFTTSKGEIVDTGIDYKKL